MTLTAKTTSLAPQLESGLRDSHMAGLDGMRAIAAFMVVCNHFEVPMVSGGEGVSMFFTLSGFLITWILLRESEKTETISLGHFYLGRSLRIFPAFYCYAAVLICGIVVRHATLVRPEMTAALLYFDNYYQAIHGDPGTGFSHTWSLAVEEQFYLLWPLAFLLFRRNYRRLGQMLTGAILAIWMYREVLILVFGVQQRYIYRAFDTRADNLLIGCLLAVMLRAGYFPRFWNWVSVRPWLAVTIAGLLALSSIADSLLQVYRHNVSFMVTPLLTAVWITQLIALRGVGPWSWMNWGWVRYLGRISYSIYLYQQLVMIAVRNRLSHLPALVQLAVLIAIIIALASASYFFVERPFLRIKKRYLQPGTANDPIRVVDDAAPLFK
jgi:peptidoglycan/LPS O-acetylase OafA/YrhL